DSGNQGKMAALAIHGGLADHRAALHLAEPIASLARIVAPDLRAAGQSHFDGTLSWELLAEDLVALLDRLAIDRALVIGTSMGSGVALRLALDFPDRVAGLVLVSPMYPGADRALAPAQRTALERMAEFGSRAERDGIEALIPIYDALPSPLRERATAMARAFDPASVATTTRFLATFVQPFDTIASLAAIALPTLIVPGTDPEHPREVAAAYAGALSDAITAEITAYTRALPELLRLVDKENHLQ
ncbi:MAG TPA: alpha/beta fold hydrolase, partial [Polyangiaceae bacterium]